jgi:acyl-ACP thioesterase
MNEINLEKASYFRDFEVNSYNVDSSQLLHVHCLFQWFSEIAWEHARMLNLGFEELDVTDYFWVLIGMSVTINRRPKWQEKVKMQSWPSGIEGMYFTRQFVLKDANNQQLAAADSKWLIYNRDKIRPVIPNPDKLTYPINLQKATSEFIKLKHKENLIQRVSEQALYTDIDMHQHVNNAIYVKWLENYLGEIGQLDISKINIQFQKELKLGDKINIFFATDNNIIYCEALDADNKSCYRAEIILKS